MENAADALKIGFAIMVFMIALSIMFIMVSKIKTTSDVILYRIDRSNYQDHVDSSVDREVETSDVISTLYRYYKESIAVTIVVKSAHYPGTYVFNRTNELFEFGGQKYTSLDPLSKTQKINTEEQIEKNLAAFVQTYLPKNSKFTEKFVEIPTSGKYDYRIRWYGNYKIIRW